MIIPSTRPYFSSKSIQEINKRIRGILRKGRLILGPVTKELEESFRDYIGTRYAVAVSSCTAALEIVLRFIDIKDREVILPTNTFVASANAVHFSGGVPVLCDINPTSLCADLENIKRKINFRTKAVIIVHIAGLVYPQMKELWELCRSKSLYLIEDAAHAVGATIENQKAGSLSLAGCFSFYPTKVMTCGTGGMITTDNKGLADFAISLRHHGVGQDLTDIVNLGNDWLLDEIGSAVGIVQLQVLERLIKLRRNIALRYTQELRGINGIKLFQVPPKIRHVYYKFPIILKSRKVRDNLNQELSRKYGISTGSIYYPPCHLQPLYRKQFKYKKGDFPMAEEILGRVLCLPVFPQMSKKELNYVIDALKKEMKRL